ncbi:MAG: transporter solute receptor, family [Dehalococcoidia bacterium]|nr:transporter solute receptor, family [Dehalococcoidia bacterium]
MVQASIGPIQPWGFVVTDPKIKTLADLKGKKVYAEIKGQRVPLEPVKIVLREGGLNPGDVEILPFADINEAAKGMSDGKAVGVFNVTSVLPLVELDRTKPLYGVPVPKEIVDKVNAEFSELGFMTWKKGDNIGKEDIPFIAQPCGMATREDMDPDIVYAILSAIYNHYDDYKDKHPVMKEWTAERAVSLIGSPVHPGAIRYFKEKGVWKDTQEKLNQKLLSQKRG